MSVSPQVKGVGAPSVNLRAEVIATREDGKVAIKAHSSGQCDRCERWYLIGELLVYDLELATWAHDGCLPES